MGGLPKFRLEMARHQERVAQPSAAAPMQDALTALLNGRIAPILVAQAKWAHLSKADTPGGPDIAERLSPHGLHGRSSAAPRCDKKFLASRF